MNNFTYNKSRFDLIDSLLGNSITPKLKKEDYHKLLNYIENLISLSDDGYAYFQNNKLRTRFGRLIINGKQIWKLDMLLKELEEKNILTVTAYDKSKTTRRYFYSSYFEWLYAEREIQIATSDLTDELYDEILKERNTDEPEVLAQKTLLESNRFKIDTRAAIEFIHGLYTERKIQINKLIAYERMVFHLNDKKIYAKKGEKGGRIFTTFNGLKRELRQFCTIDGEKLSSIDLKSAQPYFMASYFLQNYPQNKDVQRFYKLVTEGDVYTYFLERWQKETGKNFYFGYDFKINKSIRKNIKTRDEDAKPEFLKLLFKITGRKPQFDFILKEDFADVYKILNEDKANLASKLQRMEAEIFVPIATQFADKGCLSTHDGFHFKPSLREQLKGSLRDSLNERNYINYTLKENNN